MVHVQGLGSRRIAALDLGTNTFHLLIADIDEQGEARLVHQNTLAVKLGEGTINSNFISEAAFSRGLEAISLFHQTIRQLGCVEIRTAATSVLRTARNGGDFRRAVQELSGISLQLIEGEEEARLIYEGVRNAVDIHETVLIMDIGGGSVEFIIADQNQVFWKNSFAIGAARLMDRFHHSDPFNNAEQQVLLNYLNTELKDLFQEVRVYAPQLLIGSAGAFETFAIFQDRNFEAGFDQKNLRFDMDIYDHTSQFLLNSTHEERAKDNRIAGVRVDMIVVATFLTNYILENTGIKRMELSSYALKEGLLFDRSGLSRDTK